MLVLPNRQFAMYRLLVLSVAVAAAAAGPLSADDKRVDADGCVSWDAKIGQLLFEPLLEQLKKSQSEYIAVSDENTGFFGVGVEWKNGKAGNFSSLQLNPQGGSEASKLCTTGNTKTLTINLGFGDLEAAFDTFTLYTPIFNLGGGRTALSLKGENLVVEVSATTDPTSKKCTAKLDSFLFNKWGALELDLSEGLFNMLVSKLFNMFASTRIIGVLETFRVGDQINGFAVNYLTPVLSSYSDLTCQILNSNI